MFISVPFILLVSLILAVLLNNKFRGRLFFRSLFFLPVIIAGGSVLDLYLSAASGNATEVAVNESVSFGMVDFSAIFSALNLPAAVLLYEVSEVEGATKWEEFWFITLPSLGRTMFLVIVFTIVENITKSSNKVIEQGYKFFNSLSFGRGSAALWLYFLVVGIIVALILFIYNKKLLRRWS